MPTQAQERPPSNSPTTETPDPSIGRRNPSRMPSRARWEGDTLFQSETPRQAQRFETFRGKYVAIGLCGYCAAQAAYGHQHGFGNVERPKHPACIETVNRLPQQESNGWRSMGAREPLGALQGRHDSANEESDPLTVEPSVKDND